jgi:hypothetical protein
MPDSLPEPAQELTDSAPGLEELLSRPLGRPEYVTLSTLEGTELLDVHPALRLAPTMLDTVRPSPEALVQRLGAVVADNEAVHVRRRFVEPGVGRSCIAADLHFAPHEAPAGWPCRPDFLLTGIGLTPYSAQGFVNVGRKLDGRLSLMRARHRTNCAQRLADIGCRSSLSVATLLLPQPPIQMPDGTLSEPVILCRAFRSQLRVKQLDPLACVLHSPKHSVAALDYVLDAALPAGVDGHERALLTCSLAHAFERYAPSLHDVAFLLHDTAVAGAAGTIRRIRLDAIRAVAPALIERTIKMLRLPGVDANPPTGQAAAYSTWFAAEMGRQLGLFRKHRFLHDYHYPGMRRGAPIVYSLVANNVTLACEFADLETGVFVDLDELYLRQHLQLAPDEIASVRQHFNALHERDVAAAWQIAVTVRAIVELFAQVSPLSHHHALFMDRYRHAAASGE